MEPAAAAVRNLLETRLALGAFSGAAVAVAVHGEPLFELELGDQASVDENGDQIPTDARVPVTRTTMFDLASVTKVVSAHTILTLVARGALELDRPVGDVLPAYRGGVKKRVTLRHLLTHTSGLPGSWHGWEQPLLAHLEGRPALAGPIDSTPLTDREALLDELTRIELEAEPGARFRYSCAGYNTAMAMAETVTGENWRELVTSRTLEPLGLTGLTFGAPPESTAATELDLRFRRGLMRGAVHDETAWVLGGVAANAGLFGTATDTLALAEAVRRGDDPITREWMWEGMLGRMLGPGRERDTPSGYDVSMGLRVGQLNMMGESGRQARGHTGFTGTAMQADRETGVSIALLTNRVHPSRHGEGIAGLRAEVADAVCEALDRA
jgi:CubicO group peptidase (beta-lactamase class C family)